MNSLLSMTEHLKKPLQASLPGAWRVFYESHPSMEEHLLVPGFSLSGNTPSLPAGRKRRKLGDGGSSYPACGD